MFARKLLVRCYCSTKNGNKPPVPHFSAAGSHRSPWKILKDEFKSIKDGNLEIPEQKVPRESDIVIIGGGLMGSSVAYWLKQRNPKAYEITVVERDPSYTRAASALSCGGLRHQFSLPENVKLSMFTSQFLRNIKQYLSVLDMDPPDVQFNHQGYLFLATPAGSEQLAKNVKMQRENGAKIELLSRDLLAKKFPWLNINGIELASYGLEGEGWFDSWTLIRALKQKNLSLGVRYVTGEAIGFDLTSYVEHSSEGLVTKNKLDCVQIKSDDGIYHTKFAIVVNCAGPWAGEVAEMAGIGHGKDILSVPLPVEPRKRYVYVVHCPKGPGVDSPFVIDPTKMYFRREGFGGHYICGMSPTEEEEPSTDNLDVDYGYFDKNVWPLLAKRVSKFESLKVKSAWAGFYDYNYADQNLIIGNHPYHRNMFFANGLSGHGIQHAPAIGRAIMECIIDGKFETIDLSRFTFERLLDDELIFEQGIV
ncbi:FAD-dependent oxidoreductase domain-containing protein 1 [Octopus vulgaris]|uniref:FAD-dependent oxidoreductase domain-containing protein 1 n=2 Tax=Octopus TaxID=6643 RepID=A0AA36ALA8_OCTVU|nr:FAD-dependent oxidoreductase domain-containing protein 1 [Octopus sinensis]CAI9718188.1 FAD-dependent oxidoreductase domain-containing protein 1 [Octopus vulgaris]